MVGNHDNYAALHAYLQISTPKIKSLAAGRPNSSIHHHQQELILYFSRNFSLQCQVVVSTSNWRTSMQVKNLTYLK